MEQLLGLLMQHSPVVSLALIGAFALVARAYARQTIERIDSRLGRIEDVAREVGRVDADLRRLIQEMPLHYQRRDEAIREYTSMNAKMDRIWDVLVEMRSARDVR